MILLQAPANFSGIVSCNGPGQSGLTYTVSAPGALLEVDQRDLQQFIQNLKFTMPFNSGANYLLFDDFTQGSQGPVNGRVPLIGGGPWLEKNAPTDAPDGGIIFNPGTGIVGPSGLTSIVPTVATLTATAPTPSNSNVLHFASVPSWMARSMGVSLRGEVIADVDSFDSTTVTLTADVTTAVMSGDTLVFAVGSYNVLVLSGTPAEIGFTFTLADNSNQYTPTCANWKSGQLTTNGGLHAQVGNGNIFGQPTGNLTFSTAFYEGGAGVQGSIWNDFAGGYTTAPFTPGLVYTFRCWIELPFVYQVILDPTGNVIAKEAVLLDSNAGGSWKYNVANYVGPNFFLQNFNAGIVYKQVWACARTSASLSTGEFAGGVDSTPIGIRDPAPARFTAIHIGAMSVNPSSIFSVAFDGGQGPVGVYSFTTADATFQIAGTQEGTAGTLELTNGNGFSTSLKYDADGNFSLISGGDVIFGQRANRTPFINAPGSMLLPPYADDTAAAGAGVSVGELYWSSTVNAIVQRRS